MGKKKRKQDSSSSSSACSSDAKRRRSRHYHAGETSRANGGTPPEGVVGVFRDTVLEFTDAIQVKAETNRKISKLKENGKKYKAEIRMLKEELRKLKEGREDVKTLKEEIKVIHEELRILKEDHKSHIQGMHKTRCAEVDHYRASPSQRSEPSETPKFNLRIETILSSTIYKRETVTTKDGSARIKVSMYDGGLPIASNHPLASVRVDLVVINGSFNKGKKSSWSREEFEKNIIKPRDGNNLVKNDTFYLKDGSCHHEGAIIMDNSQQKEVKLGVMVTTPTEVRVLEGVSNPFKVQESKTKGSKKKDKKPSPVSTTNLVQPTSNPTTQHGQGPVSLDEQNTLSPAVIQDVLQKQDRGKHTEFLADDTRENNGQSYPLANVTHMVEGNGESSCLGLPLSFYPPPPSIQNPLQAAGYCPVNQPLVACGQDQYTSFRNPSPQVAFPNLDATFDDFQLTFNTDDARYLYGDTQMQETNGSSICGRVLLQWDNPHHVELKEHWNFLDQLMPLYSTKTRFYTENFPSTSLMDKAHKLLASISAGDSVLKMITSATSQATQTLQRRGILIWPNDSDHEPPVKKQRNAKYQLRFVNRVCSDYYTREQIKAEDGTFLNVALYDENNLVVKYGPLSSACVEVVLLHGDFNAEGQDYWTSEEFSTCLVHPQSAKEPPALGGDRVLALTDGEADLVNVNFLTSSLHARTGKFKMGVVIKNVREESVQEAITCPFLVRVRQGEEPNCHRITSLEALLRVRVKLPNQGCRTLDCDSKENIGSSSDQSSQVISVLGASRASHRTPDQSSKVISLSRPSTASHRPPDPSLQGVECSTPLLEVVEDEDYSFNKIYRRIEIAFLSIEMKKDDSYAALIGHQLKGLKAQFEKLEHKPRIDGAHKGREFSRSCECSACFRCEFKSLGGLLKGLQADVSKAMGRP